MADPGYGANGELTSPAGLVVWSAQAPAKPVTAGDDQWMIYPLGMITVPFIDQNDADAWSTPRAVGGTGWAGVYP